MRTPNLIRLSTTALIVLLAAFVAWMAWNHYMLSPWTSDARVRAEVTRVAPDISGRVTTVMVQDNQQVNAGDVLFIIDPERYRLALEQAEADLQSARAGAAAAGADISAAAAGTKASQTELAMRQAHAKRRAALGDVISGEDRDDAHSSVSAAQANLQQAQAAQQSANASQQQAIASVRQAEVALAHAQLELERTVVRAPLNSTVTNLDVRVGDYADAGQARIALVTTGTFWIYGYFEETKLPKIHVGDAVDIRLMAGGVQLKGMVESISNGIADAASPKADNLLADVQPTFNWIRLAQRIPVRVRIDSASTPDDLRLSAGMSATLRVRAVN